MKPPLQWDDRWVGFPTHRVWGQGDSPRNEGLASEAQQSKARQLSQGWRAITKGGVGGSNGVRESPGPHPKLLKLLLEQGPARQQTQSSVLRGTLEPKWQDGRRGSLNERVG